LSDAQPLISVIIPSYNRSEYLTRSIGSVLIQKYKPIEIIVIDDGSTDDTRLKLKKYGDRIRMIAQSNLGPAAARNTGLKNASGSVIMFLDSDDWWCETTVEDQISVLQANPDVGIVAGYTQKCCGTSDQPIHLIGKSWPALSLGSAAIRRKIFDIAGMFDESRRFSEDVDWFFRAKEMGIPILFHEKLVQYYFRHSSNLTNDPELDRSGFLSAIKNSLDRRRRSCEKEIRILKPWIHTLVSVIMIVKNGERFIREAIQSILKQDYNPVEIIVIDGDSTDHTADIARSYHEISVIAQTEPGIAQAYNQGIDAAKGNFIAFLSHDDLWTDDKLSTQMKFMLEHPQILYSLAHLKYFLEPGCRIPPGFKNELLIGDHPGFIMETLLARKEVFDRIGKLDSVFRIANDTDWFTRAKDMKIPAHVLPQVLLKKRIHDHNASAASPQLQKDLLLSIHQSIKRRRNNVKSESADPVSSSGPGTLVNE
jgi:glycosyltransferase involved in cell wall biosynthesis